jgi:glycogen debranching enzyme
VDYLTTREGDLFQVSDLAGDFGPDLPASGLYTRDTRFLSRLELLVDGRRPRLLGSSSAENYLLRAFLQAGPPTTALALRRQRVIHDGVMHERLAVSNHGLEPVEAKVEFAFGSDFADLFEVRGARRSRRGELQPAVVEAASVTLGYRGLDGIIRRTRLRFEPRPAILTAESVSWHLRLEPQQSAAIDLTAAPSADGSFPSPAGFEAARASLRASYEEWDGTCTQVETDSDLLQRALNRSRLDLRLLLADRGQGPFLVAGIPWYAVPFGRDSLLTGLHTLPLNPAIARGTLRTMAALQGRETDAFRQEEPGKILHEMRDGEMANLNEIPFGRYYGSVDATPLFLVLLCEYCAWTGDLDQVRELLPNVLAALRWMREHGDMDGDGLLEYRRHGRGLGVQSWKDSNDSMSRRDGRPAPGPVAVSEVQGYAYDAYVRLAPLLAALGEGALAEELTQAAVRLKERFNAAFWMEDRQFLAIALDGEKQQVGTVASDAGHCLWSGIADAEKAAAVADRLLAPDMFTGWGIRTLSAQERTYNPFSYHNGSVWPHDNALCALGLKRYGLDEAANRVATGLVEAAAHYRYCRLPELFCGYGREEGAPVDYPVSCSPQAWAATAPLALVQALLGLRPDAAGGRLYLRPLLPDWLGRIALRGLRVGDARVDVEVTQSGVRAEVRAGRLAVLVERR